MLATIPSEWEQVVCQCPRAFYGETTTGLPKRRFHDDGTRLFTCVSCEKPSAHTIYRCINCTDIFLKDFSHRRWLLDSPRCWNCCEQDVSRATTVILAGSVQPTVKPKLRHLYIHITEGFVVPSFLDA